MNIQTFREYKSAKASGNTALAKRLLGDMVQGEAPLIEACVRRCGGKGDQDDLRQAGRIGLMRAVERFVEGKGSFTHFARKWVMGEMTRNVVERRPMVYVEGRWAARPNSSVKRLAQVIENLTGTPATAEQLGITERARELLGTKYTFSSLTAFHREECREFVGSTAAASASVPPSQDNLLMKALTKALASLTDLEQRVILGNLVEEKSIPEIAKDEGLGQDLIRLRFYSALAKLRDAMVL